MLPRTSKKLSKENAPKTRHRTRKYQAVSRTRRGSGRINTGSHAVIQLSNDSEELVVDRPDLWQTPDLPVNGLSLPARACKCMEATVLGARSCTSQTYNSAICPACGGIRHVKTVRIMCRKVKSCSRPDGGGDVCPQFPMIGASLTSH